MANFAINETFMVSDSLLIQSAGAHVHLYTTRVLGVVCSDFKLSVQGQRNVSEGLSNVPSYYTQDEKLTLGWPPEHIIRNRAVFEKGYEHLALNCALCDTFHEKYAAYILHELAAAAASPLDVTPHYSQWLALLRSCNGALAMSGLSLLVEEYIRLDPYNFHISDQKAPSSALPRAVANALRTLADVISGRQKQVTIRGSPIVGWFAAVGEWLYNLRVAIWSSDGNRLHGHDGQKTQLLIVYEKEVGVRIDNRPWTHDNLHAKDTTLGRPAAQRDPAPQPYAQTVHAIPFGGRVTWQALLPNVFGRAFRRLDHEESKTFGIAVGSAAVTFRELAESQNDPPFANPSSYGEGLIQTLTNYLPELRRHQGRMERQLKLPFSEAKSTYFEQINHLQHICACTTCAPTPTHHQPREGYCLTALVEAIIALALLLSRITVAASLYPTRHGIQSFYAQQVRRRLAARHSEIADPLHFTLTYGHERDADDTTRLANCIEIFSGVRPKRCLPRNLIAVAHEGICCFLNKMMKPGAKDERLISVVTGGINIRCKVYTRATLGPVDMGEDENGDRDEEAFWERVDVEYLDQPLYLR